MEDHAVQAEALFRGFAQRHSLTIERVEEPNVDLMMRVPHQHGLSFDLTLALQNGDALNIGFADFWSHFFPFEQASDLVLETLDALVVGDARLANHAQFGWVVKRVLELRRETEWQPVYTHLAGFEIPFLGTSVSYIYNSDMRIG